MRIVIANGGIVGPAEKIIDDTCLMLVVFIFLHYISCLTWSLSRKEVKWILVSPSALFSFYFSYLVWIVPVSPKELEKETKKK